MVLVGARSLLTRERRGFAAFWLVLLVVLSVHGARFGPQVSAWLTVFVAICVQACPYVVLGVLVTAALRAVPLRVFAALRAVPDRWAVPLFATCGAALPGCECGSVALAGGLLRRGVSPGASVALMLSAPAVNPVVVVATMTAFPGRPAMVLARVLASFAVALAIGWWAARLGAVPQPAEHDHDHAVSGLLAHNLGLLVVGAALAAGATVLAPPGWLDALGGSAVGGAAVLALAAVLMSVCSSADAFVASSFTRFSPAAQVAFMVVGAVLDLKLISMYVGTFGRRVTQRLVPVLAATALASAVVAALAVGLPS